MHSPLANRLFVLLLAVRLCSASEDPLADAVAALQSGNPSAAEQILQNELHKRPKDGEVLEILAVTLDQEKKYLEADGIYRRAMAIAPHSAGLLNNYGNHYLAEGKLNDAKATFLQVLAAEPAQTNARVQLASIALQQKAATQALSYLDRLPEEALARPGIALLKMQAEYAAGHTTEGDVLLARITPQSGTDPKQNFSLAVALASAGQYEKAEQFFSRSLEQNPADFETLYDLGLAASHAGHNERARSVLEQALQRQPTKVDVLYDLAAVNLQLNQEVAALELLAKGSKLAPQRADILQMLARTSAELGYFSDAVGAWQNYLRLNPADEAARRELAFDETATGDNFAEALRELQAFVQQHPADGLGHYELGTAEAAAQPKDAIKELTRALALNPNLPSAHIARGLLLYKQNKLTEALSDFERAAQSEPENPIVLEHLGQTYMALNDVSKALPVLRKAAAIAPTNSTILMQFGRALEKTGQSQEASQVFARCRELGPSKSQLPHPTGLLGFLGLPPEEQLARYRAGVEATVRKDPTNVEAKVRYLEILLNDGQTEQALSISHKLADLKPSAPLLAEAVEGLLAANQYSTAAGLLAASEVSSPDLRLDDALATFNLSGAKPALTRMNKIPTAERDGNYYLALGEMLEADGRSSEATAAFEQAAKSDPKRPELYREAALQLIHDGLNDAALHLLNQAAAKFPEDSQLQALFLNAGRKLP